METRSVKLAASIIASQEHLPIAEAEETVHFMDRQSGCSKHISHEEFKPYFDMLDWCWERQQEIGEEARSRNYHQIEAKLDLVNFERDIEPSFARRTGDTAESKQTESETESTTSDTLMTEEELQQAIERQIFASQRPNSLETMKNKMRDQELSDEQLDDAVAAGLKEEMGEAEEVVNEVEEGIEEGIEDGKDEAQKAEEVSIKKPTASRAK
jgi:hypothetical protein